MAYARPTPKNPPMFEEDNSGRSITGERWHTDNESTRYKSKNLNAERRRRKKLSDRLLLLRATVPIITNLSKATIIDDAITYIRQQQNIVNILKDQLVQLEASSDKKILLPTVPVPDSNKAYIQADVRVFQFGEQKLWIKIVFEKRKGAFTQLIQALNSLGFELMDTSVTTINGVVLVTTIIKGIFCQSTAQNTEDLLLRVVRGF